MRAGAVITGSLAHGGLRQGPTDGVNQSFGRVTLHNLILR